MVSQKLIYYCKRLHEIGPITASWLLYAKATKYRFSKRARKQWQTQQGYPAWNDFSSSLSFESFLQSSKQDRLFDTMWSDLLLQKNIPAWWHNKDDVYAKADALTQSSLQVLGYHPYQASEASIPWHSDFTNQKLSPKSWKHAFYTDVIIPATTTTLEQTEHGVDIKVPWELSRLQHLFILARAYSYADKHNDSQGKDRYTKTFIAMFTSWYLQTSYLHGACWNNPMEVAIRAMNMSWCFHFFKTEETIPTFFWKLFFQSLHAHTVYLEHNWEVSDKPNNHYIADLVGYLYSCLLFASWQGYETKIQTALERLNQQFKKQILADGCSYEGSTAYHALDTELLLYTMLVSKHTSSTTSYAYFETLFARMCTFLNDCMINNDELVLIGDNDSGIICTGIAKQQTKTAHIQSYDHFGLTIIKDNRWHVTFRHPTFNKKQPSGHFHNDQLSITLAIDDIPLVIDPGSYVYTAHSGWRNTFRNTAYHNTFHVVPEPNLDDTDLFQLDRIQQGITKSLDCNESHTIISDYYTHQSLRHTRTMSIDKNNNQIVITDSVSQDNASVGTTPVVSFLHLHDLITVEKLSDYKLLLKRGEKSLVIFESITRWEIQKSYISPRYGEKRDALTLCINSTLDAGPQQISIKPCT